MYRPQRRKSAAFLDRICVGRFNQYASSPAAGAVTRHPRGVAPLEMRDEELVFQHSSEPSILTSDGHPKPALPRRLVGFNQPACSARRLAISVVARRTRATPPAAKQSARTSGAAAMSDDVAPCTALAYLDPSYWDQRFGKEEHYEWLKDFSHFRHLLSPLLSPSISVLDVGCGSSRLGEDLLREGVAGGITCIDLSPVAVQRMRDRLAEQGTSGVDVVVADMLDMPFESESFDLVIEKGTMDALSVDIGDPWNPNPTTVDNIMKMLEGIHKVLKPDGIFVSITFGQPHFRRRFFEAPGFTWSVEWSTFGDGFHYFFYTLQKGKRSLEPSGHQDKLLAPPSINMLHEELESEDYIFRTNVEEL